MGFLKWKQSPVFSDVSTSDPPWMSCVTIAGLPTLVPRVFNLQEDELWEKKKNTLETKY